MLKALKELTKDSLTYGVADALGKIIGFLLIPLYTSYLSPTDYGIISMLAYIYAFFSPLASLGITNAIFRRYNLHKEEKNQVAALSTGSIAVLILSALLLGIGLLLTPHLTKTLVSESKFNTLTQVALVGAFFTSIGGVFTVVLRAMRLVKSLSIALLAKLFVSISLTILLVVVYKKGVAGVIWANAIGAFVGTIILLILCRKYLSRIFDFSELNELLKYGLPFLPHRIFSHAIVFFGPFLIKEFSGLSTAGLYEIALKFTLPLTFVISAVQQSWVPIKFQIHREETEQESKTIFKKLISVYFVIIATLFIFILVAGPEVIRLMVNERFHDSVHLYPLILLVPLAMGNYYMMGTGFEFTNNTKPMPVISFLGLVTIVAGSYLLYPFINIYGILFSMVATQYVMAFAMLFYAVKRFYVPLSKQLILFLNLVVIAASFVIYSIQDFAFWHRILISSVTLLLTTAIIAYLVTTNDDFKELNLEKYPVAAKVKKLTARINFWNKA